MNDQASSGQGLARQLPASVGVPTPILIFAGAAVVAVLVGTVSVPAGFALFVLGLLALVIFNQMLSGQDSPSDSSGGSALDLSNGYLATGGAGRDKDQREDPDADIENRNRPTSPAA